MNTLTVTLPWPPAELSPNARGHWARKSKAAKKYREVCHLLALEAGAKRVQLPETGKIRLDLAFYPPTRRIRDDDNLVASFKSGRDGLADALGLDDSRFITTFELMPDIGGMVKVSVEADA